jgi:hypothetical protein
MQCVSAQSPKNAAGRVIRLSFGCLMCGHVTFCALLALLVRCTFVCGLPCILQTELSSAALSGIGLFQRMPLHAPRSFPCILCYAAG